MSHLTQIIPRGETKIESDPILGETVVTPIAIMRDGVVIEGRRLTRFGITILDFSQLDPFAFYPDAMYGRPFLADIIFDQLRALMAQITEPDKEILNEREGTHGGI